MLRFSAEIPLSELLSIFEKRSGGSNDAGAGLNIVAQLLSLQGVVTPDIIMKAVSMLPDLPLDEFRTVLQRAEAREQARKEAEERTNRASVVRQSQPSSVSSRSAFAADGWKMINRGGEVCMSRPTVVGSMVELVKHIDQRVRDILPSNNQAEPFDMHDADNNSVVPASPPAHHDPEHDCPSTPFLSRTIERMNLGQEEAIASPQIDQ